MFFTLLFALLKAGSDLVYIGETFLTMYNDIHDSSKIMPHKLPEQHPIRLLMDLEKERTKQRNIAEDLKKLKEQKDPTVGGLYEQLSQSWFLILIILVILQLLLYLVIRLQMFYATQKEEQRKKLLQQIIKLKLTANQNKTESQNEKTFIQPMLDADIRNV